MTPTEYAETALKTHDTDPKIERFKPGTGVLMIDGSSTEILHETLPVYAALAMCGEAGEFAEKILARGHACHSARAAEASELGDVLWYTHAAARDLGLVLVWDRVCRTAWTDMDPRRIAELTAATGRFAERVKKSWRDPTRSFDRDAASEDLHLVLSAIMNAGAEIGYTLEGIAELNIKKCLDRRARGVVRGEGDHR